MINECCVNNYAPPLIGGALSDDAVGRLSDVCLSRTLHRA